MRFSGKEGFSSYTCETSVGGFTTQVKPVEWFEVPQTNNRCRSYTIVTYDDSNTFFRENKKHWSRETGHACRDDNDEWVTHAINF